MKCLKTAGGIFILAGTTIGAGMLALPVVTAFGGFFPAILLYFVCWVLMLCSAFFLLDVLLSFKGEANFISMTGKTLGIWGKGISWIVYLLILYSLISAYLTACAPLLQIGIQSLTGYTIPSQLLVFCLPLIFGWIVYMGTDVVDNINRVFILGLFLTLLILLALIPLHVHPRNFLHIDFPAISISIPVILTAFAYQFVIPSLSRYFNQERKPLVLAIVIGSLIPLILYILWSAFVIGVVPLKQLGQLWQTGDVVTESLILLLKKPWIGLVIQFFSFFAINTTFLGVSLSLSDFLIDGFKIKRTPRGRLLALVLTFVPPLLLVLTYKKIFYLALEHAGALFAILIGVIPAAMAWRLKKPLFYTTFRGKVVLSVVIALSLAVITIDLLMSFGMLTQIISKYTVIEVPSEKL